MALESEISKLVFTGNGSTSVGYPITFPYLDPDHIKVGIEDVDGNIADLDEDEYTVTSSPAEFKTTAAYSSDVRLAVYRQMSLTQPTVFPIAGALSPAQLEQAFDRQAMLIQQLARAIDGNGVFFSGEGDGTLRDTYMWADEAERGTIKPRRRGQLGIQLSDESVWRSDSASVGDWVLAALGATGPAGPTGGQGIQGIQGPPMTFKGTYSGATSYAGGEVVTRLGSAWIALRTTIGNAPESSPSDFSVFADGGDNGWTPVLAVVNDSARRVQQVIDWTGGEGTKPATGKYVGPTGFVTLIGDGVDIRGAQGPTGAAIIGPTGPTGPGVISAAVVTSATGGTTAAATVTLVGSVLDFTFVLPIGPTGAASSVAGPAGPAGPVGADGMAGPTGPKGSFVKTDSGIYELACAEGTRPYFFHIRETSEAIPPAFLETITGDVLRFPSHDGRHELCFGVRCEFPDWFMPRSNARQMAHSVKWWNNEYLPDPAERGPTA